MTTPFGYFLNTGDFVVFHRIKLCLTLATLLLFVPFSAWAQDDNAKEAVRIAQEAAKDFKAERFLEAAKKFERAFELYQDATLLKNQAVAYYKADVCPKALESAKAYRSFVASNESVPEKDKRDVAKVTVECEYDAASRYIETREFALAQASIDDARSAGPSPEMATKLDQLESDLVAARESPEDGSEEDPVVSDSTPQKPDDGGSILPIVGWSAVGVGAAVGVVAGVLHLSAFSKASDGQQTCEDAGFPNGDCAQVAPDAYQDWSDGVDSINSLVPLYIVSGVVTAAGIGILVYHYTTDGQETALRLMPSVGAEGANVQLQLRF